MLKWFHEITEAIHLKTKFKTRKEKCILVVKGTIVSQNPNKRKIVEVQAAINKMISAASTSAITPFHIPSSDPSIFWQSAKAQEGYTYSFFFQSTRSLHQPRVFTSSLTCLVS
jgi:hypothetical protein